MFKQMGELVVDHRASPGLTEEQARLAGYIPELCREGKVYRQETMTCSHCRGSVVKNPFRTRERHSCMKCGGHYICDGCAYIASQPDYVHTPMAKMLDAVKDGKLVTRMGSPQKLITS
jgi:hypothetical protein